MKVDKLAVEHRDRLWRDSDGDDWKFSEGCWHYRRPGANADEWDSTETDEEPNGYGPFEQVWERFGLSLTAADFDRLGTQLDRITAAERRR